ncbi:MAG: hypothetical protein ABJA80_17860 [bacterium]
MTSSRPTSDDLVRGDDPARLSDRRGAQLITLVFALALTVTFTLAAFVYAGAPYAVMALVTSCVAIGGWLRFGRYQVLDAPVAFNFYIGTLVALMMLYSEEWYLHYPSTLMRYFPRGYSAGVGLSEHAFIAVFPLTVSAFMTLGALAHYRGTVLGQFSAWLVFAWGGVAAIAVYLIGPLAGQPRGYVGGMLAAPVVLIVSALGIRRLVRSSRGWHA